MVCRSPSSNSLYSVLLIADRSAPINLEDIGTMHFRLTEPTNGDVRLMSADIKLGGPTIFVVISRAQEWPFVIENDSDYTFSVYQTVRALSYSYERRIYLI